MQFAEVPAHCALKSHLIKIALAQKVPHAQLFIGPPGSANLALALSFATYLNCSARQATTSCGLCTSCLRMAQLAHPDLLLIFPKKAVHPATPAESDKHDVELFRSCVKENPFLTLEQWSRALHHSGKQCQINKKDASKIIQQLSLKPFIGPYKIVCIWLAECLHHTAANALLKTLEEPPEATVFLLIGSNSEKILPTIQSRCQQHVIPPFSQQAIAQVLSNKFKDLPAERYQATAFLAQGDLTKAFELIQDPVEDNFGRFSDWMRSCYSANLIKLITQSELFYKLPLDTQKNFFTYALQLIRMTLLHKLDSPLFELNAPNEANFSKKFALNVSISQLKKIITELTQAYYHLERNGNAKMIYAHISIQIVNFFKAG